MKKVFLCVIFATLAFTLNAQVKVAVMDFKAGVGVSNSDVAGISAIFSTYFSPSSCTLVERTQVNRVIIEQGFQQSYLTNQEMVRIGQILNVQKIVVGDINIIGGQYNIDVRVVDVETGNVDYKDGETWARTASYRDVMKRLAERLSSQIRYVQPVYDQKSPVITLFGYLKIYPEDLGEFETYPHQVVNSINSQAVYGYNTWRLQTKEELEMMMDNHVGLRSTMVGYYYTEGGQIKIKIKSAGAGGVAVIYGKPRVRLVTTGQPVI